MSPFEFARWRASHILGATHSQAAYGGLGIIGGALSAAESAVVRDMSAYDGVAESEVEEELYGDLLESSWRAYCAYESRRE